MPKSVRPYAVLALIVLALGVSAAGVRASGVDPQTLVLCLPSPTDPSSTRTITVPWSTAWYYLIHGATLGPCVKCEARRPGLTCGESEELDERERQESEQAEDIAARVVPDRGDPLPIGSTTKSPDPRVMGRCIDNAFAAEAEVGYSWAIAAERAAEGFERRRLGASSVGGGLGLGTDVGYPADDHRQRVEDHHRRGRDEAHRGQPRVRPRRPCSIP